VLGSHSKKRPHNITLGRLYDFHLYDALELGVESHRPISSFRGAGTAQVGNKVSRGWFVVKCDIIIINPCKPYLSASVKCDMYLMIRAGC
jgi:hypothetical protein